MEQISLVDSFPPVTEADWLALVEKALNGAPFDTLRTQLRGGLRTEPLYTARRDTAPFFETRGWTTIQPLTGHLDQFRDDLANGAGAFSVDFDALAAGSQGKLKDFLAPDAAYHLAPGSTLAMAAFVIAAASNDAIKGSAGFDPLTAAAKSGELPAEKSASWADYADAAFYLHERCPGFVPFMASGQAWESAGGTPVQELAFTLAAAVAFWRALTQAGMPIAEAGRCIGFTLTSSADLFLTIAKFRSLRLLWARALGAAGQTLPKNFMLLARMSSRILTAYDAHVNLLRGTAAAFGAAIGGASGIEILPFDGADGAATPFSRRLARNTSLILQEESHLAAVADAAAGSAYVETLTDDLAAKAWGMFRHIEEQGGLASCLESGFVHDELRRSAAMRKRDAAYRRDKITGVSVFPNLTETLATGALDEQAASAPSHPYVGMLPSLPAPGKGERFAALIEDARSGALLSRLHRASRRVPAPFGPPLDTDARDAEPFETLRRRADLAAEKIGSRPPIFLALIGKPDEYRARASWVQSFFAAGGIEMIGPETAFESKDALAGTFRQSPAPVACLCSSNAGYASMTGAAAALKKAGAVAVYLAGPPAILKTLPQEDNAAIDRLIFEGCNALALLRDAQAALQVEELSLEAADDADHDGFEVKTHSHDHGQGECGC